MRSVRVLATASILVIAACSSSGDDASGDAVTPTIAESDTDDTTPPTEPAATDPVETEPVETAVETEPVETAVETETVVTEPEQDATDDVDDEGSATTDAPLVIDGPADVRPSCASLPRGVTDFTLEAGGGVHDVRIFVPETISSDPAPTVLNWHGLGSNGPEQAAFTGYETLAEAEGFIVVHPTGLDIGDGSNSWELTQFDTDDRDDLAFADELIDTVIADWCADTARIYSTGMSNGGLFTSELVCNRSTRIAAAASVAGTSHAPSCAPERAVPYMAFHGTADTTVPFDADEPSTLLPPAAVSLLIDDTELAEFGEFAADASCDADPAGVDETDEVIRYDFTGCDDDVPMTFYEIVGGGHTWPSSPLSEVLADFGFFTQDIDATADAYAFMSQFTL